MSVAEVISVIVLVTDAVYQLDPATCEDSWKPRPLQQAEHQQMAVDCRMSFPLQRLYVHRLPHSRLCSAHSHHASDALRERLQYCCSSLYHFSDARQDSAQSDHPASCFVAQQRGQESSPSTVSSEREWKLGLRVRDRACHRRYM